MKTINVSFEDTEIKAIEKAKRGQSWRKFILERAAIDSANEIQNKGLNADALRGLCLEYDLAFGRSTEKRYEGFALLCFFLKNELPLPLGGYKEEIVIWEKRIAELKKAKAGIKSNE